MPLLFQNKIKTPKQKLIMLVFAGLGPFFLLGGTRDYLIHQHMLKTGIPASAKVINAKLEHANKGADRYHLDLTYKAGDVQQKAVLYLYEGEYESLQNPATLPILYLKEDPEKVELRGGSSDDWMGVASGLFMTLFGWWAILPSFLKAQARQDQIGNGN